MPLHLIERMVAEDAGEGDGFVLAQSLRREHHLPVAALCVVCDALLVAARQGRGQGVPIARWREPLAWVDSRDWPACEREPVPLVVFPSEGLYRRQITDTLDARGIAWRIAYVSASLASLQGAVSAGIGVSLLPARLLQPDQVALVASRVMGLVVSGVSLLGDYSTIPDGGSRQTYTNSLDYTISDNATVDSPITVSGRTGYGPSDASVTVDIRHTYQGDLKVDLVAPDGSLYNVHNRTGNSTDNIIKTVSINLGSEALNGAWKLRVYDGGTGDTGYINSWSINF